MPITADQLEGLTAGFHAQAEKHFRADGKVVPALWFVPDAGTARLVPMPNGVIGRDQIAEIARASRPLAILLTGESWLGSVTIPAEAAARLSLDDIPRPSEQAERREVIATRAVGRGPGGGLLHAMRTSLILRTVFDVQLLPFVIAPDEHREDDFGAFLAGLLLGTAQKRQQRKKKKHKR